jgi:small-conductance mechanosensitive channel
MSMQELARQWAQTLRLAFSEALWGIEFDQRFPYGRLLINGAVIVLAGLIVTGLVLGYLHWIRLLRRIRRALGEMDASELDDVRAAFDQPPQEPPASSRSESQPASREDRPVRESVGRQRRFWHPLMGVVRRYFPTLGRTLWRSPYQLRQLSTLVVLLARSCLFGSMVALGLSVMGLCLMFPVSRFLAVVIGLESLAIPVLWIVLGLLQPMLVLVINQGLNLWKKNAEASQPGSGRYSLRVSTYSEVLKMMSGLICVSVGLYGTVLLLGVDTTFLAGAGVLAIGIGFLSRNLLEDMLSGLMILFTDRYAIGDVICLGDKMGLVEEINMHLTKLRGDDGRLLSIPNRQIQMVENLTQEWARVDFKVRVAAEEDLERVMMILENILLGLWQDPRWRPCLRAKPIVTGILEISRTGTLIGAEITTEPRKQWIVGNELRLRTYHAFRKNEIILVLSQ